MRHFYRLVTFSVVLGLSLSLGCSKNPTEPLPSLGPFEAGPILFTKYNKSDGDSQQLYSMNEDGSDVRQLTDDPDFPVFDARWSPDGEKIAFTSLNGSKDPWIHIYGPAIFVMDKDGSNVQRLTTRDVSGEYYATGDSPQWSPDGRTIAFHRLMIPEALGLYGTFLINSDGSNERQVPSRNLLFVEDWSPDGNRLLVQKSANNTGLITMHTLSLNGVLQTVLSDTTTYSAAGRWSADGRIVFSSMINKTSQLFLTDKSGTNPVFIPTVPDHWVSAVDWSADGKHLLIRVSNNHHMVKVYIKNLETGALTDITPFPDGIGSVHRINPVSWRKML